MLKRLSVLFALSATALLGSFYIGEASAEEAPAEESTFQTARKACRYNDPSQTYVSRDPQECQFLLFACAEGSTPFFNECGCGCQTSP